MQNFPAPTFWGAPTRFSGWRPEQLDAIERISDTDHRFIAVSAPTGIGKSLIAVMAGLMNGWRTLILTSTKSLQDQYVQDFSGLIADIRGQSNYDCIQLLDGGEYDHLAIPDKYGRTKKVDYGPCRTGVNCPLRDSSCHYWGQALPRARSSNLVIANYSYWLAMQENNDLGKFDLIVLDEGHSTMQELSSALATTLTTEDFALIRENGPRGENVRAWKEWGAHHHQAISLRIESLTHMVRLGSSDYETVSEINQLKGVRQRLGTVANITPEWVVERKGNNVEFDCIWPAQYAEEKLFRGVKKVVILSATLVPKTVEMIGPPKFEFLSYDSSFPLSRRPVYYAPSVRMNFRATDEMKRQWMRVIDSIVASRRDRKGIIHTVSYKRRNEIFQMSKQSEVMVTHDSNNTRLQLAAFKSMPPPAYFLSPSVGTGVDLPFEECTVQIIPKIPYPDTRSKVMQARNERDDEYTSYIAAAEMVQMSGRGMRGPTDACETFIVDDNWKWFRNRYRHFFPMWWMRATKSLRKGEIPKAPELDWR